MKARDVMVSPVTTTHPETSIADLARTLLANRISGVPVVDQGGSLVGIVSEGDLLHRSEAGTERRRPWWLAALAGDAQLASDYIKAHGRKVKDVMSRRVVTATPDTPLHEIASLLEKNKIKRVPIMEGGRLVGIVTRANLLQAMATGGPMPEVSTSDAAIRERLIEHLNAQPWANTALISITVKDGSVDLWGLTNSDVERTALRVAAETSPGVRAVHDNLVIRPVSSGL